MAVGDTLTSGEIRQLKSHLRAVAPRTVEIAERAKAAGLPAPFEALGAHTYVIRVQHSTEWFVDRLMAAAHVHQADPTMRPYVMNEIDRVEQSLLYGLPSISSRPRKGLTQAEYRTFGIVIRPDHPANPWPEDQRFPAFVILLVYRILGLRAGEPRLFYTEDFHLTEDGRPAINIMSGAMSDTRARAPSLKRDAVRTVILPAWFGDIVRTYIGDYRSRIVAELLDRAEQEGLPPPAEPKHLFLTRLGTPISRSTVERLFITLREACPDDLPADLTAARLRNSFADAIVTKGDEREIDISDMAEHSLGWTAGSPMLKRYANQAIARKTGSFLAANMAAAEDFL
jgi:hypothetical protein